LKEAVRRSAPATTIVARPFVYARGNTVKIAIASQNRREVTAHAGQCRRFWVVDLGADAPGVRTLVELEPGQTFHASHAGASHPLDGIDVLIAGGMGMGLRTRLAATGVRSIVTGETDLERVLAAFAAGTLADTPSVPHGHHDHHDHHDHHVGEREAPSADADHGSGCGRCGCSHR
jgi:predicted Fe-Mo cluster-binding NifX family protein